MLQARLREHFLETVRDLQEKSQPSATDYEVKRGTLLVRQLFLDGQSLVDQVNRHYRERIEFDVNAYSGSPPDLPGLAVIVHLTPGWWHPTSKNRRRVSRNELFRMAIGELNAEPFSIRDLLDHIGYAGGGIHLQKMSTRDEELAIWDERARYFMGASMNLAMFRNVTAICHEALLPLVNRVL